MATKTRRKQRTTTKDTLAGKDTFHVLGPTGGEITLTGFGPKVGLLLAQERALRDFKEPVVLTVERRHLFGPATTLYRVERDAHGMVKTVVLEES